MSADEENRASKRWHSYLCRVKRVDDFSEVSTKIIPQITCGKASSSDTSARRKDSYPAYGMFEHRTGKELLLNEPRRDEADREPPLRAELSDFLLQKQREREEPRLYEVLGCGCRDNLS